MTPTIESLPGKWREEAANQGAIYGSGLEQCADELAAALASQPKDGELLARVGKYVAEHERMRGIDPDVIHELHVGTEREAVLRLSDLRAILRALASRRVVVDNAMRKRTREWLAANHGYWDDDYVERLLTAAFSPEESPQ